MFVHLYRQNCRTKLFNQNKNMDNSELNTEQIILEAAEAEFITKGYGNAKMVAIAKRAGVSHSMLHYYFRKKENLFQTIFRQKVQIIAPAFEGIFEQHLSFFETVRLVVETQFNFVAQNPKLPHFLISEILSNKENRSLLLEILAPKITKVLGKFSEMFEEEIRKGTVRPMLFHNFMLNIVSVNISTFIIAPILKDMVAQHKNSYEDLLKERRESNVQFILNALRP